MRINRYLAQCGVASRRKSEALVLDGRVQINGELCSDLSMRVKPADTVEVDGKKVSPDSVKKMIIMNKPVGVLCTKHDPGGGSIIYDLLPGFVKNLRYVGRLDRESRGLLLLGNDGELIHRLTHPSFEISRRYFVKVDLPLEEDDLQFLVQGVDIGDGEVGKALKARFVSQGIELVLAEGKKREIRRMMNAVGREVLDLQRVSYATIELDDLEEGSFRFLDEEELGGLYALVDLDRSGHIAGHH